MQTHARSSEPGLSRIARWPLVMLLTGLYVYLDKRQPLRPYGKHMRILNRSSIWRPP